MTDQQALHLYATRRDAEAFRQLVTMYQQMVYAAALRRLGDREDAADATQQAFIRLANHAKTIRGDVGAWLHRTAVNAATDLIRSAAARRERERQYALAKPSETWPGDVPWEPISATIDEAIAELDAEHRELIVQHFLRGRSQTELAAERGMNQSTMSRRVASAVDALRTKLLARGVTAPAVGVLATGLAGSSASAGVPAGLTAELAKVGLLGGGAAAAGVGGATAVKVAVALACVAGLAAVTVPAVLSTSSPPAVVATAPSAVYGKWYAVETFDGRDQARPGELWMLTLEPTQFGHGIGTITETAPVRWDTDGNGGILRATTSQEGEIAARYAVDQEGRLHMAFHRSSAQRQAPPPTVDPAEGVELTIYSRNRDDWQPPRTEPAGAEQLEALAAVYGLADGENLRMVRPPFPDERHAYVDAEFPYARSSDNVASVGFRWDGHRLHWTYMRYPPPTLDTVRDSALRIPWYAVAGLDDVRWEPGRSDWIVRDGLSVEQQLAALAALVREKAGIRLRFERVEMTRPVIVARGELRLAPENEDRFRVVTVTVDPLTDAERQRWIRSKPREATHRFQVEELSEVLDTPMFVDEARNIHAVGLWYIGAEAQRLRHDTPGYREKLRQILDNLAVQLGGEWTIEDRPIQVWRAVVE